MSSYHVELRPLDDFPQWESLLQKNSVRCFWGMPQWLRALAADSFAPHILALFKGETAVGGIAVMASSSSFIRRAYSAVLVSYSPLVLQVSAKRKPQQEAERVKMIDALLAFAEQHFDYACLSVSPENQEWRPFFQRGWQPQIQTNYWVPASCSYDGLKTNFHPDLRRALKKTENTSLYLEETDTFEWMKTFYQYTFARQGKTPMNSGERLEKIWLQIPQEQRKCFLVKDSKQILAAMAVLVWDQTLYCWQMGRSPEGMQNDALAWLIAEVLRRYEHFAFDFNGSSIPSIGRFFRNFGADHHTFFTFSHYASNWRGRLLRLHRLFR